MTVGEAKVIQIIGKQILLVLPNSHTASANTSNFIVLELYLLCVPICNEARRQETKESAIQFPDLPSHFLKSYSSIW